MKNNEIQDKPVILNRITIKNAWNLPIIDNFSTNELEYQQDYETFQKASAVLQTCAEVYATRIDDVSTTMCKLLDNFEQEQKTKKLKHHKEEKNQSNISSHEDAEDYIARKFGNKEKRRKITKTLVDSSQISLKDIHDYAISDVHFRKFEKEEKGFLGYSLSNNGFFSILNNNIIHPLFLDFETDITVNLTDKFICPKIGNDIINSDKIYDEANLKAFENIDKIDTDKNYMDDDVDVCFSDHNVYTPILDNIAEPNNFVENTIDIKNIINKAWAGPNYWKITNKHKVKNNIHTDEKRIKKGNVHIDFNKKIDVDELFKDDNSITMSHESIQQRRNNKYLLPEDLYIQVDDIYSFFNIKASFKNDEANNGNSLNFSLDIIDDSHRNLASKIEDSDMKAPEKQNEGKAEEYLKTNEVLPVEFENNFNTQERLRGNFSDHIKGPKRVDIKKLKLELYEKIVSVNEADIVDTCSSVLKLHKEKDDRKPNVYDCILSLLQLANEKKFDIVSENTAIKIKRTD
ncbi:hypothetical protein EDEG_00702 [Edhazardia aedis USNM 41457]|uniref:Condensin complex subunit 2 n=1 Tax=Edhazardia aedis (strain USNM 41457) TaxID=1003232 RepID=J9DVC1_EDHAE|nr:hypothetical protein EDEG_00702 [Edhazardia aedis USNM 41457]|eukprot:EJW05237.1 hypothetical protein EDEG_00702 [Edhazardia aedis USNM 41457]